MLLLLAAVVPESPRFLLSRPRRRAEAVAALTSLRGNAVDVRTEIRLIRQGQRQQQQEQLSWRELRLPVLYKPLAVTVLLMTLQQFSGINAVMLYAESIFRAAHIQNSAEAPVMIAAVQVVVTLLSGFLMDRAGRKLLLCLSGVIMAGSAAAFGAYFQLTGPHGNGTLGTMELALPYAGGAPDRGLAMEGASTGSLGWLALASMLVYIVGFSLGWGPIPWIVMSEVFPVRWRGVASGVCVAVNWISAFVVTKEFHDFSEWLGFPGAFWFFASVCAAGFVLTIVALPETKGRSLEQIQAHFEGRPPPPSPPSPPLAASSTPAAASAGAAAVAAAGGSLGQAAVTGAGGELSVQEP